LSGVNKLLNQYTTGASPLGLSDGTVLERAFYLSDFLLGTLGLGLLLAAASGLSWTIKTRSHALGLLSAVALATLLYLGTRAQFYERNFSHILPVLFVLGAVAVAELVRQLTRHQSFLIFFVTALMVAVPLEVVYTIRVQALSGAFSTRINATRNQILKEHPGLELLPWANVAYRDPLPSLHAHMAKQELPLIVEFLNYDDAYFKRNLDRFLTAYDADYLRRLDSPFKGLPPCEFQAYLATSRIYYLIKRPVRPATTPAS
jgi:hypothetical protein